MEELDVTCVFNATPQEFYYIVVEGYIEPHDEIASIDVVDGEGRCLSRMMYNTNSGIYNANMSFMMGGFDGEILLTVVLQHANWVLSGIVKPTLTVKKVGR